MTLPVGMPIAYRNGSGQIFPGFISGNNGNPGDYFIHWDTTQNGAVASYVGPTNLPARDDTLTTNNSWAPVGIVAETIAKFEGT